ncbi:MAG: hypothetical protein ABI597_14190 [Gammaproteobacteria bacterium]
MLTNLQRSHTSSDLNVDDDDACSVCITTECANASFAGALGGAIAGGIGLAADALQTKLAVGMDLLTGATFGLVIGTPVGLSMNCIYKKFYRTNYDDDMECVARACLTALPAIVNGAAVYGVEILGAYIFGLTPLQAKIAAPLSVAAVSTVARFGCSVSRSIYSFFSSRCGTTPVVQMENVNDKLLVKPRGYVI